MKKNQIIACGILLLMGGIFFALAIVLNDYGWKVILSCFLLSVVCGSISIAIVLMRLFDIVGNYLAKIFKIISRY